VKLTTHLQLVPKSRKRGFIHQLPHTPSWRSAYLVKYRDKFIFSLSVFFSLPSLQPRSSVTFYLRQDPVTRSAVPWPGDGLTCPSELFWLSGLTGPISTGKANELWALLNSGCPRSPTCWQIALLRFAYWMWAIKKLDSAETTAAVPTSQNALRLHSKGELVNVIWKENCHLKSTFF
jgi:hypothetical protein